MAVNSMAPAAPYPFAFTGSMVTASTKVPNESFPPCCGCSAALVVEAPVVFAGDSFEDSSSPQAATSAIRTANATKRVLFMTHPPLQSEQARVTPRAELPSLHDLDFTSCVEAYSCDGRSASRTACLSCSAGSLLPSVGTPMDERRAPD